MAKLWQSALRAGLDPDVEAFLSSLAVDSRLLECDLECSIAHARMLGATGILSQELADTLVTALQAMLAEAQDGRLAVDIDSEDIHSFIEEELTRRLGDAGKAIHAGRSRNDQVAVAFRLYALRAFSATKTRILNALKALLDCAGEHCETLMPGYTHLQRAQPVTLAHHLLAWCAGLERDYGRFADARRRADESPLGSGALAGSGLPVDREATSAALGFARPSRNTMDAVADRDFCVEYAAAAASLMTHLSRACEDIALWASAEYGFVRVLDAASTGSSIMPQKRNPDPAELIRGKAARVFGALQALLVLQKGLPYAYNRDLQEDKELFFDIQNTVDTSLRAFTVLVHSLVPDVKALRLSLAAGFMEATDIAEYLVLQGIPFRTAYQAAKACVAFCLKAGRALSTLSAEELQGLHEVFGQAAVRASVKAGALVRYLAPEACVARRAQTGGPAPARTRKEIARLRAWIAREKAAGKD